MLGKATGGYRLSTQTMLYVESDSKEHRNMLTPQFSPTYPALIPVPSSISDNTLNYAGRYRSRARIPALTYIHPVNNCSITRCSQPLVGVRQNRSIQDEKLLAAIFSTTRAERPLSSVRSPPSEREDSGSGKEGDSTALAGDLYLTDSEALEDAVIAKVRADEREADESDEKMPMVYGAQQRNMIVDARPTVNAYAMQAVGLGSENMDNYKFATKVYLGIDNIHVMRDSLNKVIEALKDSDVTPLGPNRELLHKSHWLKHIANMLDGVGLIARQVGLQHSHVLIHCSDGWDRTSQLSALSQLCLDPYYRTFEGFIVLVEKDWLAYGHRFQYRTGPLSSEKWFQIENERIGGRDSSSNDPNRGTDAMAGAQKTFENALLSAKGFFSNKEHNASRDSLNVDSDGEPLQSYDSDSPQASRRAASNPSSINNTKSATPDKHVTKVKETAPIFHTFLDATYQLMYERPTRFEFSERFSLRLLYHLYSCQYGSFLYDNEQSREEAKVAERTRSVWDYFLSRKEQFLNPKYDPVINDNVRGKERLIFPRADEVRWWNELFGRTDEEMNPKTRMQYPSNGVVAMDSDMSSSGISGSSPGTRTPVLTGGETAEQGVGVAAPSKQREAAAPIAATLEATTEATGQAGTPAGSTSEEATSVPTVNDSVQPDTDPVAGNEHLDPLGGLTADVGTMSMKTGKGSTGTGRKIQSALRQQMEIEME